MIILHILLAVNIVPETHWCSWLQWFMHQIDVGMYIVYSNSTWSRANFGKYIKFTHWIQFVRKKLSYVIYLKFQECRLYVVNCLIDFYWLHASSMLRVLVAQEVHNSCCVFLFQISWIWDKLMRYKEMYKNWSKTK